MLKRAVVVITIFFLSYVAMAKGKTIYTSSVKNWSPASLEQLIEACEEGSAIVFDADYDYTVDRCLKPKVSITIKGNGKKLRTINKYNYVISLFDVCNVNSFEIENLVLDGSYDMSNPDKTEPKEFFITIKDVNNVAIKGCTFQNIRTVYPNWKEGDDAYTIWVENYYSFSFTDNIVKRVKCPEFLKAVLPVNNTDPTRIADISHNKFDFESTSSAIEVRFSRFRINNNDIGYTHGSSINSYGFDSEIIGNIFHGSRYSSSIDLSEQFFFKYVSHNVLIKNNYSEYSRAGFLMGHNVYDITIQNNVFRADIHNKQDFQNRKDTFAKRQCDASLLLNGDISNIVIRANHFEGANSLIVFNQLGHRKNILIENNTIKNVSSPIRSSLIISQTDGIIIRRNKFINTGYSFSYYSIPQFIVIGKTDTTDESERYVRNVLIANNTFSFTDNTIAEAYIVAHTVYDPQKCGLLSSLNNITIKRNKSSFKGDVLLVSDVFSISKLLKSTLSIKRNRFQGGVVQGNMIRHTTISAISRNMRLDANTMVEVDGSLYYVVVGGVTSSATVVYGGNDYIVDGKARLRKMTE